MGNSSVNRADSPVAPAAERLLSPSRILLIFWLGFEAGVAAGNYFTAPLYLIGWSATLWLLVILAGHSPRIEATASVLLGSSLGFGIWQVTGGESWLELRYLQIASDFLVNLRELLAERIFASLDDPHNSLLAGIMLGNRIKLDPELLQMFRTVGLSHLIAVSGYNLTIISQNVQTVFQPLVGRNSTYIAIVGVVAFVLLTGAPASVVRAAVMAIIMMAGTLLGRPTHSLILLVTGAGLITVFQPKILFDVGFQLSIAATYGLLRLTPLFQQMVKRWSGPQFIYQLMSETIAASVITAPILMYYFEQFSPISLLSNLLVLPIIPMLMALGALGLLVALLVPALAGYGFLATWPLLNWIIWSSSKISHLPLASLSVSITLPVCVAFSAGLIIITEVSRRLFLKEED